MNDVVRVVIVDDHALLTESLVRLLSDEPGVMVVATEATARAGIETALRERPDVVVMDYLLPDMDGAAATRLVKAEVPETAVIMLTGSERHGAYSAAMQAGCSGWVRKTRAARDLLDVIHRVAAGEVVPSEEYEDLPPLRELVVHYQPVVELIGHRVVGFEALVRWQHPHEGLLSPDRFLPLAEETGYVIGIDRQVAQLAVRDLSEWQRVQPAETPLWVGVNMSATTIGAPGVQSDVAGALSGGQVDPASLVIEITETALLEDTPEIASNLRALKDLGVGFALDDFGTAFSSLSYLRRFPFDHVKIDTSFTADLPYAPRAVLLVESIAQLCAHIDATPIAEGIERADQESCLVEASWRLGQGYLYSAGVPFEQASEIARRGILP